VNYRGGCQGLGSDRRWCAASEGRSASFLGGLSQHADHLADTVGSNDTAAASAPYLAASSLRTRAEESAKRWRELTEVGPSKTGPLWRRRAVTPHVERHGRGFDSLRFHVLWLTRERRPEIRGAAVCVDCESNREVSQRLPTMTRNSIGRVAPC
jgi:hypothetical protein